MQLAPNIKLFLAEAGELSRFTGRFLSSASNPAMKLQNLSGNVL